MAAKTPGLAARFMMAVVPPILIVAALIGSLMLIDMVLSRKGERQSETKRCLAQATNGAESARCR